MTNNQAVTSQEPINTTQIDILRHGHCEGGDIFRGHTDVALSAIGHEQMQRTCELAETKWQVLISSPLKRCLHFAKALQERHDLPLEVEERLREMSFGDWDGQDIARVHEQHAEAIRTWRHDPLAFAPPNGEDIQTLSARVAAGFGDILERHRGKRVLIVTHGGVIRVLLAHALELPLRQANAFEVPFACLSRLQASDGLDARKIKLAAHNFAPHKLSAPGR